MRTRIVVNGREYASVEEMPDDVRQAYRQALAQLADADRNGVPGAAERGAAGHVISVQQSSITVNGRTLETTGEMPAFVRHLCEGAMSPGARSAGAGLGGRGGAAPGEGPPRAADAGPHFAGAVLESLLGRARHRDPPVAALDRASNALERFLAVLLGVVAVAVLAGGGLIIARMDASSRSQGGRFYVALAVVLALGAIEGQAMWLARRRWGSVGLFDASDGARRVAALGLLALVLAAALLVFALLRP